MDFSSTIIWDVVLNATGYIAAGALSVVLYSWVAGRGRHGHKDTQPVELPLVDTGGTDRSAQPAPKPSLQFINLVPSPSVPRKAAGTQRGRAEVFGRARRMIKEGASPEAVKAALPVSEAELALLSLETR